MSIKTVLITGANGFIAKHIARTLHLRGYKLFLLDRHFDPELRHYWLEQGVSLYTTAVDTFSDALKLDAVIHAAALTAEPQELNMTPEAYLKASLDTHFYMLTWARTNKLKCFIFISSAGVFSSQQQTSLTETAVPLSKGVYALAKRTTEDLLETLAKTEPCHFISVRLGNVYGEAERPSLSRPRLSLVQRMLKQALAQQIISVPNETARDWTYLGDIAHLFDLILKKPVPEYTLYHFVSKQQFTALELAQKIQQHVPEVKLELSNDPIRQLRSPLQTERLPELGFSDWTPFDKGLPQVIGAQHCGVIA